MFTIAYRSLNQGIPKYEVKDYHNDPIIDTFSTEELEKVIIDQDTLRQQQNIAQEIEDRENASLGSLGWVAFYIR